MPKKLFLLDGMALVYRAHFAFVRRPIFTSKGLNTSALFGFTQTLLDILTNQQPTHLAVAFDTPAPTARHREFPDYKAQREETPEDILQALPHVRRLIEAFHIPALALDGYEADDLIGTLVKRAEAEGFESYMVTADKDFSQLVTDRTFLYKPGRSGSEIEILGPAQVREKWGVAQPEQVIDILGLWGDASDNIPGVPGIGEKTASKLVAQYGSVENLLQHAQELKGKQRESLEQHRDQALLSKRLATINLAVPLELRLDDLKLRPADEEAVKRLLIEFEFNAIGRRLFGDDFKAGRGYGVETTSTATATGAGGDLEVGRAVPSPPTGAWGSSGQESAIPARILPERPLTPALSPSEAERVVEDRVRGHLGSGSAGLETSRPPGPVERENIRPEERAPGRGEPGPSAAQREVEEVTGEQAGASTANLKTLADVAHQYRVVADAAGRAELVKSLLAQPRVAFTTQTTGDDPKQARLLGLAFCFVEREACFVPVPVGDRSSAIDDSGGRESQSSPSRPDAGAALLAEFRPLFESEAILKVGHDLKFDLSVLKWHGVEVRGPLFDVMLAHALIEPALRHSLEYVAEAFLGYTPAAGGNSGEAQTELNLLPGEPEPSADQSMEKADLAWQLRRLLEPQLKEKAQERVFYDLEAPLIPVLVDMEVEGVRIDAAALTEFSELLSRQMADHETAIHRLAGAEFNLNSPRQLGEVLFDQLKLADAPKKTRTGQYATDEQTLLALAADHEIVRHLLDYRACAKLKSTYADALPAAIFPRTGRVHTTYEQLATATGRLNSQNPNLQNIPIRTELGQEIRKAFVPRGPDHLLLSADYSQIELRIIASLGRETTMIEALKGGADVHTVTAARVFGVPPDAVTPEMRRQAKMVNYGIAYGISAFGLAQRLGLPRKQAAGIIDHYFAQFPAIRQYMTDTVEFARQHGYVETVTGRRRALRDIRSANATVRAAAERNAINAPIQGTAADMIKLAMIAIHQELKARKLRTRMLLQVHDELVFDLYGPEGDEVMALVKEKMETAIPLEVPIQVEMGVGHTWLEAH
jgi:DNA polymerase-1